MTEDERTLLRTRETVLRKLAPYPVTVYLIGSYARGDPHAGSDVDIAVEPHGPFPAALLSSLREELEESTIPRKVEVIDLRDVDPEFRDRVRKEGVIWSASGSA